MSKEIVNIFLNNERGSALAIVLTVAASLLAASAMIVKKNKEMMSLNRSMKQSLHVKLLEGQIRATLSSGTSCFASIGTSLPPADLTEIVMKPTSGGDNINIITSNTEVVAGSLKVNQIRIQDYVPANSGALELIIPVERINKDALGVRQKNIRIPIQITTSDEGLIIDCTVSDINVASRACNLFGGTMLNHRCNSLVLSTETEVVDNFVINGAISVSGSIDATDSEGTTITNVSGTTLSVGRNLTTSANLINNGSATADGVTVGGDIIADQITAAKFCAGSTTGSYCTTISASNICPLGQYADGINAGGQSLRCKSFP